MTASEYFATPEGHELKAATLGRWKHRCFICHVGTNKVQLLRKIDATNTANDARPICQRCQEAVKNLVRFGNLDLKDMSPHERASVIRARILCRFAPRASLSRYDVARARSSKRVSLSRCKKA
jgi:hypothetical protein